jgi:hypothetical protein
MSQAAIVLILVALASAYVVARAYRTIRNARRTKDGCGAGCGCDAPSAR